MRVYKAAVSESASGAAWSSEREGLPGLHSCNSSTSRRSGRRTGQAPWKPAARGALASVSALRRRECSPHGGGCRARARWPDGKQPVNFGPSAPPPWGEGPTCWGALPAAPSVPVIQAHAFVVFTLPSTYLWQGASCKPEERTGSSLAVFSFVCCASAGPTPDREGGAWPGPILSVFVLLCVDDASAAALSET